MPEIDELNEALSKGRVDKVTISVLTEVELPKADEVFEISIKGLG